MIVVLHKDLLQLFILNGDIDQWDDKHLYLSLWLIRGSEEMEPEWQLFISDYILFIAL